MLRIPPRTEFDTGRAILYCCFQFPERMFPKSVVAIVEDNGKNIHSICAERIEVIHAEHNTDTMEIHG